MVERSIGRVVSPAFETIRKKGAIYLTLNKGAMAIGALTAQPKEEKATDFTKLESGQSIKVRVKSAEDLAQYFNYGLYGAVKSFVPTTQATRDAKGYVVSGHSAWDLAEKYYR